MKKGLDKKGFTLIEMLVVIAIVAILVAIIIPTLTVSVKKANAAADAANLRSVLGEANVIIFNGQKSEALASVTAENVYSKSYPDATMQIVYTLPGFIDVYFVDGSNYYGLDYFSEVAEKGSSDISTAKPTFPASYKEEWHTVGGKEG